MPVTRPTDDELRALLQAAEDPRTVAQYCGSVRQMRALTDFLSTLSIAEGQNVGIVIRNLDTGEVLWHSSVYRQGDRPVWMQWDV